MTLFDTGIPNIRVVIREAKDENVLVDVPNLVVKVEHSPDYSVNIVPSTQVVIRSGSFFNIADLALNAVSSSYALTASYALNSGRGAGFPFSGSAVITGSLLISSSNNTAAFTVTGSDIYVRGIRIGAGPGSVSEDNNVVFGNEALGNNTTGVYNTAIGHEALRSNTSGVDNTAIGYHALSSSYSASSNLAVGAFSLNRSVTGIRNVALGAATMYHNVSGQSNTAVGAFAQLHNESGSFNTSIGVQSFEYAHGDSNTMIGAQAGRYVTGSYNTYLGRFNGSGSLDFRTGSNYIVFSDGESNIRQYYDGTLDAWVWVNDNVETLRLNTASLQVNVPVVATQFTGSLYGTASVADGIDVIFAGVFETGSAGVIIPAPSGGLSYITSASYAFTASYALNGGGGGNIDTSSFATTGSNVFKNNQTVSGSINITNNNVLGDTTTSTLGGTPIALNYGITKGDLANRFSGIKIRNYDWSGGNLAGEVSIWTDSEAQDFSTQRVVVDGFGNVNVTGSLTVTGTTNISGSLYGTSSWASNVISSSFATSASRATTSSFTVSSSFATSSSRAVTSSFALTASFASNASIPAGTLSSSTQVSALGFATTASNTFNGNQTITGSLLTNADTLVFSGSMYTSGSVSITGSLQATHFILLTTAPTNPETGSMYFSGSFIYVYTGTQYRSASLA